MSDSPLPADPLGQRANVSYWQSSRSVNQIAEEMDVSKSALYGLIDPLPTELLCPRCSTNLVYANRTARDRGLLCCSECGLEGDEEQLWERWQQTSASARLIVTTQRAQRRHALDAGTPTLTLRDPFLLGVGLLLAATGFWLFFELRRRP